MTDLEFIITVPGEAATTKFTQEPNRNKNSFKRKLSAAS